MGQKISISVSLGTPGRLWCPREMKNKGYAIFGGQIRCIIGNVEVAYWRFSIIPVVLVGQDLIYNSRSVGRNHLLYVLWGHVLRPRSHFSSMPVLQLSKSSSFLSFKHLCCLIFLCRQLSFKFFVRFLCILFVSLPHVGQRTLLFIPQSLPLTKKYVTALWTKSYFNKKLT